MKTTAVFLSLAFSIVAYGPTAIGQTTNNPPQTSGSGLPQIDDQKDAPEISTDDERVKAILEHLDITQELLRGPSGQILALRTDRLEEGWGEILIAGPTLRLTEEKKEMCIKTTKFRLQDRKGDLHQLEITGDITIPGKLDGKGATLTLKPFTETLELMRGKDVALFAPEKNFPEMMVGSCYRSLRDRDAKGDLRLFVRNILPRRGGPAMEAMKEIVLPEYAVAGDTFHDALAALNVHAKKKGLSLKIKKSTEKANERIYLDLKNASLFDCLNLTCEQAASYVVPSTKDSVSIGRSYFSLEREPAPLTVSLDLKNASLFEALLAVCTELGFALFINENGIVILRISGPSLQADTAKARAALATLKETRIAKLQFVDTPVPAVLKFLMVETENAGGAINIVIVQ